MAGNLAATKKLMLGNFWTRFLGTLSVLTEADEEGGHGLVLGHVDQPPAQAEVREDQQHLLDDVIDVGDVLGGGRQGVAS